MNNESIGKMNRDEFQDFLDNNKGLYESIDFSGIVSDRRGGFQSSKTWGPNNMAMTFDNCWSVSIVFGNGCICSTGQVDKDEECNESPNVEVAVFNPQGQEHGIYEYQNANQVAEIISRVSKTKLGGKIVANGQTIYDFVTHIYSSQGEE